MPISRPMAGSTDNSPVLPTATTIETAKRMPNERRLSLGRDSSVLMIEPELRRPPNRRNAHAGVSAPHLPFTAMRKVITAA